MEQFNRGQYNRQQKLDYILKVLLPKVGKTDSKHRKFLFSCLSDLGYISKTQSFPDTTFEEVPYNEQSADYNPENEYLTESTPTETYGFTRTFISPNETYQAERLSELQKRGISSQETEYQNIKEIVESTLEQINKIYPDISFENIRKTALDNYRLIMNYYSTNQYKLPAKSGALKRGYIGYCIYYALLQFRINITKEQLVQFVGINLSDLPKADEYIKIIIPGINVYNVYETNLCGMNTVLRDNLGPDVISQINKVITDLKNKSIFSEPPTKTNIAAAIYYVCSIPQDKGGIYPSRLKIQSKPITYEFLQNYCKITKDTVRKEVDKIIKNKT